MNIFVPNEIIGAVSAAVLSGWMGALVWTVRVLWQLDHRLTTIETALSLRKEGL